MPRAIANPQTIIRAGLAPTYQAAPATNIVFANNGRRFLHVKNSSGAAIDVAVITPGTVDGLSVTDRTVTVPNAGECFIGPFPTHVYNNVDGTAYADFSSHAGVTYALFDGGI